MVNRVVLGAHAGTYVLRVSRPGFAVTNEAIPIEAVAFDSRWTDASNIFMRGSVSVPSDYNNFVTVNYGQTFPESLFVFATMNTGSGQWFQAPGNQYNSIGLVVDAESAAIASYANKFEIYQRTGATRTVYYTVMRNWFS